MEFPTIREPKNKNPNVMILYSMPKAGKTTIVSQLKDSLVLELEPGGGDYVTGRIMEINNPKEWDDALKLLETSPTKVCEYLIVDTITKTDEWAEIVGTYRYMNKPQGKSFNRETDEMGRMKKDSKGEGIIIRHTDVRFETVHELGQGFGYQHSRTVMTDWYDRLLNLIPTGKVKYIILVAHVKDKLIETRRGDIIDSIDINLTGKVKSIYAARADAIGFFYRKDKQGFINFNNEYKVVCGGRCAHLDGEILISEKQPDGKIVTFWDNIYIK